MRGRKRHKRFAETQGESRMHIGEHKEKSCGKSDQKKQQKPTTKWKRRYEENV